MDDVYPYIRLPFFWSFQVEGGRQTAFHKRIRTLPLHCSLLLRLLLTLFKKVKKFLGEFSRVNR